MNAIIQVQHTVKNACSFQFSYGYSHRQATAGLLKKIGVVLLGLLLSACQEIRSSSDQNVASLDTPVFVHVSQIDSQGSTAIILTLKPDWDQSSVINYLQNQIKVPGIFSYQRKLATGGHLIRIVISDTENEQKMINTIDALTLVRSVERDVTMKPMNMAPVIQNPVSK